MLNLNIFGGWCCGCGWKTAGSATSEYIKVNDFSERGLTY